jgi:hypothetical protein
LGEEVATWREGIIVELGGGMFGGGMFGGVSDILIEL